MAGIHEEDIRLIEEEQAKRPFVSLLDFCARLPMHRDRLENLILAGAFDSLHEHRRGLLWRLEETIGIALSYRGFGPSASGSVEEQRSGGAEEIAPTPVPSPKNGGGELISVAGEGIIPSPLHPFTPSLNLGSVVDLDTPIAWELDDFTPWEKFQWNWRITGICAECHVFAYLRERLAKRGIMTAYDAMRQKAGTRVTVAGLNIRPHRPRTVSGNPVLFTLIEDETEMLQAGAFGETIQETTLVFLTSPAVLVRGTIERRGSGCSLLIEKAKPLRMQDFVGDQAGDVMAGPPPQRTYTGTKIHAEPAESAVG